MLDKLNLLDKLGIESSRKWFAALFVLFLQRVNRISIFWHARHGYLGPCRGYGQNRRRIGPCCRRTASAAVPSFEAQFSVTAKDGLLTYRKFPQSSHHQHHWSVTAGMMVSDFQRPHNGWPIQP